MATAMAASLAAHHHHLGAGFLPTPRATGRTGRSGVTISMRAQRKQSSDSGSGKGEGGEGRASGGRRVWRRRKLTKEDDMLRYKLERIPFLEEKVRKVRENGKIICLDINQLMLSQENRFAFTMEVAEEANAYLEKNRHEYGLKKPILHVLSDRINEAGFSRPEGYLYPYPIKPGPYFIKEEGH
uniref:Protein PLASTID TRANSCRIPTIONALLY ACTIVE 7 n=1 Tax=Leersia perrieri TaxID=77586 RepID=A0A0D9V4P8_9ORYZ